MAKNNRHLLILFFLTIFFLVSSYLLLASSFFKPFRSQLSFSVGDRYYGTVRLWYYYATLGDWAKAVALEPDIDPVDINLYRQANYPPEIKKRLNLLATKTNKTPDDYIELAKIQASLEKYVDATRSAFQAAELDPVRSDLEKIYYQILP